MSTKRARQFVFNQRQALVLAVCTGLFLCFLLTTLLLLSLANRGDRPAVALPEGGPAYPSETAVTSGATGSAPAATKGRSQTPGDSVNIPLAIGPEVTNEAVVPGRFFDLLLVTRLPNQAVATQTKIMNVEVVAVEAAEPPERPEAVATLRMKRRDAEMLQEHKTKPGFKYYLVKAGLGMNTNDPAAPLRVLFLCVENSNRSQMAEAFARMLGGEHVVAYSAGSRPSGKVNPKAIAAMAEIGYDLSAHRSKGLAELPEGPFDVAVTMGCGDSCPATLAARRFDWNIPDPKQMSPAQFNLVRDQIQAEVRQLLAELAKGPHGKL